MAIKPKSRAHEDRIKALEAEAKWNQAMRETFLRDMKSLMIDVYAIKTRRRWQFWK